ncbi:MAG: DMT family transporter [Hyphomonadaceae bacterium]|nr:DMT family transporter [Hyphomonadaceae bacterium]
MTDTFAKLAPKARTAPAWLGPVSVLAGGVCIGFAPIGLRIGLQMSDLGPQAIALWRYMLALPVLFALCLAVERRVPVRPNPMIVLAGICFALDIALLHWALERTTVANATFMVNLGNIGVGLVAWIFLRERPTWQWLVAVAIAVTGAGLLSLAGAPGGKASFSGDVIALGAAVLVAFYMLCSKLARGQLGAMDAIFWLTATEICVAILVTLISGERLWPTGLSELTAPLFLALVVQVGGQGLIIFGLGRTPAAIAGIMILVQPVTAAAISWQLFDEPLNTFQGFGALLILAGVLIAQSGSTPPQPTDENVTHT